MREKGTEKPRGFGFAIFEDTDVVDKLCIKRYVRIKVSRSHDYHVQYGKDWSHDYHRIVMWR